MRHCARFSEMLFKVGPSAMGGSSADFIVPIVACAIEVASLTEVAKGNGDKVGIGDWIAALFRVGLEIL